MKTHIEIIEEAIEAKATHAHKLLEIAQTAGNFGIAAEFARQAAREFDRADALREFRIQLLLPKGDVK